MRRVTIDNERLRVAIEPALGAGVADFSLRAPSGEFVPIWRRAPEHVSWWNDLGSYALVPWCNRIAGGVFTFEGRRIELAHDWKDGTAIHGVVKDRAFEVLDRSPVSARFLFDSRVHGESASVRAWPWAFSCVLRYELDERSLTHEVSVTNRAEAPMPCGVGFHPHFVRALWDPRDEVVVAMNVAGRYPCTGMIPSGAARPDEVTAHFRAARPLGTLDLDDVFAGSDGRMSVTWPASGVRARFECSPDFGHSVVYSPVEREGGTVRPFPHFCLEPVSMVNDGFNLLARGQSGTGVRVIAPDETMSVTVRVVVDTIRA